MKILRNYSPLNFKWRVHQFITKLIQVNKQSKKQNRTVNINLYNVFNKCLRFEKFTQTPQNLRIYSQKNVNSFDQKIKMLHFEVLVPGKSGFIVLITKYMNYIT